MISTNQFKISLARLICEDADLKDNEERILTKTTKLIRKIDKDGSKSDFALPSLDKTKVWSFLQQGQKPVFADGNSSGGGGSLSNKLLQGNLLWSIQNQTVDKGTLFLSLDRAVCLKSIIASVVRDGVIVDVEGKSDATSTFAVHNCELSRQTSKQLSRVRAAQVCSVVARLLTKCGYQVRPNAGKRIKVGCSDAKHLVENETDIPCQVGHVGSSSSNLSSSFAQIYAGFYRAKSEVADERGTCEGDERKRQIHVAAAAEVTFQLLSKNLRLPTSSMDPSKSEASFVLYNNARIVQVFRAFRENYDGLELPDLDEVGFEALVEAEEWDLVFRHVLPYLDYIRSVRDEEVTADKLQNLNKICNLTVSLANCFSKYYRRVRILRDPQPKLLNVMYARLYLILTLRIVNQHALDVLGIRALKQM